MPITRGNVELLLGRCVALLTRARALDPTRGAEPLATANPDRLGVGTAAAGRLWKLRPNEHPRAGAVRVVAVGGQAAALAAGILAQRWMCGLDS